MKKTDEEFSRQAREAFDASVDRLDAATLSKLNQGRHAALAELDRPVRQWARWGVPATGVAAAVAIAVMVLQSPAPVNELPTAVTDMEILLGEDSIEMLEELEFYSWIDTVDLEADVG